MIKNVNEEFFVLKTDNGFYLQKSKPTNLTKNIHEATAYNDISIAERCLNLANYYFNMMVGNRPGYWQVEARKLGVSKIMIAKITLQQYDEIIM